MAVFFKQEAAAEKRLEISGMPGRDREEEESCKEKEKNEEVIFPGADCPVEGKERRFLPVVLEAPHGELEEQKKPGEDSQGKTERVILHEKSP